MRSIGYAGPYGELYDSPGGSGGGYMAPVTVGADGKYRAAQVGEISIGWARNPNYGASGAGSSGSCGSGGGGGISN